MLGNAVDFPVPQMYPAAGPPPMGRNLFGGWESTSGYPNREHRRENYDVAKKNVSASEQPEKPLLVISREEAERRLQGQIDRGKDLLARTITDHGAMEAAEQEYFRWDDFNFELIKAMFNLEGYALQYRGFSIGSATPRTLKDQIDNFHEDLKYHVNHLESLKDRLVLIPEDPGITRTITVAESESMKSSNKVFVVHGHDELAKQSMARFIEKLGLEAVILHEKANLTSPTEIRV